MKLIIIFITILFYNYVNSSHYYVGNESSIKIDIPKPSKSYITYYLYINVDICEYEKNDSYIIEGNKTINFNEYYNKSFSRDFNNQEVKILGSDLKFIDYGVYVPTCSSPTEDTFNLSKDGDKYKIKAKKECMFDFKLYVIKNDNSDFVNLCNIYYKKNIVLEKEIASVDEKELEIEFELDSNLENGIYKVVLIEETDTGLFKYKPQFIEINKMSAIFIILIVLACALVLIVIAYIIYKKFMKKDVIYEKYKKEAEANNNININMQDLSANQFERPYYQ